MNYRQRWTKFIQFSYLSNRPFMHFFSFSENTIKCTPFFGFNSIVEEKMHIVFLFKLQFITINNSRTFWDLDKAWRGMLIISNFWLKKYWFIFGISWMTSPFLDPGDVYYIHVQAMLLNTIFLIIP